MSPQRKATAGLLVTFASILLVWDIYVAHNTIADDTISELLRDVSYHWWSLPFILGIVMGHLFWNQPEGDRKSVGDRAKDFWWRVFPLGALMLTRDLVNLVWALPTFAYVNLIAFVGGFLVGARWWPQAEATKEQS